MCPLLPALLLPAALAAAAPPQLSVADFGALGDGVHDDTDAVQAAMDALCPHAQVGDNSCKVSGPNLALLNAESSHKLALQAGTKEGFIEKLLDKWKDRQTAKDMDKLFKRVAPKARPRRAKQDCAEQLWNAFIENLSG